MNKLFFILKFVILICFYGNAQSFKGTELCLNIKILSIDNNNFLCELFESRNEYVSICDSVPLNEFVFPTRVLRVASQSDTLEFEKESDGVFTINYFDKSCTLLVEVEEKWIKIPAPISARFSNHVELNMVVSRTNNWGNASFIFSALRIDHVIRPRLNYLIKKKRLLKLSDCNSLDLKKEYIMCEVNNVFKGEK